LRTGNEVKALHVLRESMHKLENRAIFLCKFRRRSSPCWSQAHVVADFAEDGIPDRPEAIQAVAFLRKLGSNFNPTASIYLLNRMSCECLKLAPALHSPEPR
jgi:hypothetical protein